MYYLEIETPEGTRRIQLTRERVSIGRLSYNDIVLPSAQISRQHAEMRQIDGEWWIADLHSTNGLHLDAQRIEEHRLAPGDCVLLAPGISVRFLSDAPPPLPASMPEMPPWRAPASDPHPRSDSPTMPPVTRFSPPLSDGHGTAAERLASNSAAGHPTLPDAGGYPVPPGPMRAGSELHDPFRRNLPAREQQRDTENPAQSLLHVCQTCGQLTAPDAVYCQSCQQPIAYECPNCRLSLLPIQERCPRCQTPNPGSVRRARRNTAR